MSALSPYGDELERYQNCFALAQKSSLQQSAERSVNQMATHLHHQQPQPAAKRSTKCRKTRIPIVDPLTGENINFENSEEQDDKTTAKHFIVLTNNSTQTVSNVSAAAFRQTNGSLSDAPDVVRDDETKNCNKWKPLRMDLALLDLNQDEKKTLFLLRTFTSQLNKITPDNCLRLIDKIKNLPINSLMRMQSVVDIIYEKAIRERNYVSLYAQICHRLKDKKIVNKAGTLKTFSSFLLARCTKNFDISLTENLVYERKKFEIDLIDCSKTRKLLLKECSQEEIENGERFIGNCFFIGELFKWGMIQKRMILQLIDRLFNSTADIALICICTILSTIGKFYEDNFGKISSTYFEKIESLCEDELSPRIRFLLLNLLELRKNSWCLRIQPDALDFESTDFNDAVENSLVVASIDKIPEREQPRHDDVPIGLLSREIFNSVTDELKELPLFDVDVKSEAKKYTVEFLSSCRTFPQCNKPVTISSPEFADKLLKKDTNDPKISVVNHGFIKKVTKNESSSRSKPTSSSTKMQYTMHPRERKSKYKKKTENCPCGDSWGCCECNDVIRRLCSIEDDET